MMPPIEKVAPVAFVSEASRATKVPSPLQRWDTKWKASEVPNRSDPPPRTVKVPFDEVELPALPTAPTSLSVQAPVTDTFENVARVVGVGVPPLRRARSPTTTVL